jgi:hypothetical protein
LMEMGEVVPNGEPRGDADTTQKRFKSIPKLEPEPTTFSHQPAGTPCIKGGYVRDSRAETKRAVVPLYPLN